MLEQGRTFWLLIANDDTAHRFDDMTRTNVSKLLLTQTHAEDEFALLHPSRKIQGITELSLRPRSVPSWRNCVFQKLRCCCAQGGMCLGSHVNSRLKRYFGSFFAILFHELERLVRNSREVMSLYMVRHSMR